MTTATCTRCGETYTQNRPNQKYCRACSPVIRQERSAIWTRARREREKAEMDEPARIGGGIRAIPLTRQRARMITRETAWLGDPIYRGLLSLYLCYLGDDYPAEIAQVRKLMMEYKR